VSFETSRDTLVLRASSSSWSSASGGELGLEVEFSSSSPPQSKKGRKLKDKRVH
jgi:hypothetical protein